MNNRGNHAQGTNYNTTSSTDLGREETNGLGNTDHGEQNCSGRLQSLEINRKLEGIILRYEIPADKCYRLRALKDYEIIVIGDDSGSMNTTVDNTNVTRWDELRNLLKIIIEFGTIFDPSGVDVFFLNRPQCTGITDPRGIDRLFIDPPSGFTPLAKKSKEVIEFARANIDETKKVLLFIATDGLPTDDKGYPDLNEFTRVIRNEIDHEIIHIMFLLCTDEQESVDYLTAFRTTVPNVHVCDDYETERRRVRHLYGRNSQFTRTDYYIHALVSAITSDH
ncbi:unnamed protein product [Adineta ricciae]|uniref:VWFA domain-containing protein n=1 Tax=Adineta ricciae TaxID=249248 RepID=A0A815AUY2_ADIRI|nr:unnamed protein product [Adineta ricciae]